MLVILIWELIPTTVVIILFKIKRPSVSNEPYLAVNTSVDVRKSVFLDPNSNNNSNNDFTQNIFSYRDHTNSFNSDNDRQGLLGNNPALYNNYNSIDYY